MATRDTWFCNFTNDRYRYDFRLCTYANGWDNPSQQGTHGTSPWGTWVNPTQSASYLAIARATRC